MKATALTAEELIDLLHLRPLPREGGFFAETHRGETIPGALVGDQADRAIKTAIYYLMTPDQFSAMHRLPTAELFHFYLGDPVEQLLLFPDGSGRRVRLGHDLRGGARPQSLVPGGIWQGARLAPGYRLGYALLGTTMAPGFDARIYEHGERVALLAAYPTFAAEIVALTRANPANADGS